MYPAPDSLVVCGVRRDPLSVHLLLELRETPPHEVVGTRSGLRADVPQTDRFAGLLFDKRKFHRTSGVSVDEFKRKSGFSRDLPLVPDAGGEPVDNFVRIWVDYIARQFKDERRKEQFLAAVNKALMPYISDRGLRWEMHIDETPFSLWTIEGLRPPPAEQKWPAENKASVYEPSDLKAAVCHGSVSKRCVRQLVFSQPRCHELHV